MLKQYFFRNRFHWKLLPFDRHTLISFFTRVEQELGSISTPSQKTYSNLTLKEKAVLNDPKNNQSNIIKPCDQGGGICIMNTRDYFTKFHTHLPYHNTKKEKKLLTHNPTNAVAYDAWTLILYIHSQFIIDVTTMKFLLPPWNTGTPFFYELPKMH